MTTFVALLRAVNVGGTGKLPMATLRTLCADAGFGAVRTLIASGNVVLESDDTSAGVKARLEQAIAPPMGRHVPVLVRTAEEIAAVLDGNPFADAPGSRVLAIFLDAVPSTDAIDTARHRRDERIALGTREIYVDYGDGIGTSKLVLPAAREGTARNMNTVAKLAAMARG